MDPSGPAKVLLEGYRQGIFPMSEGRDDPNLFWVNPQERGIFPINGFRLSRSLKRTLMRMDYDVRVSSAFAQVVSACAERSETWINQTIFKLYCELAEKGKAHSIEIWQEKRLVGGVYGVVDGSAFFGGRSAAKSTGDVGAGGDLAQSDMWLCQSRRPAL